MMRRMIDANDLPEYDLREEDGQSGPLLLITRRTDAVELAARTNPGRRRRAGERRECARCVIDGELPGEPRRASLL